MSVARRLRLCSAADRYHEEESDQSENDSSTPHSDLLTAAEERRDQGDKGWNHDHESEPPSAVGAGGIGER